MKLFKMKINKEARMKRMQKLFRERERTAQVISMSSILNNAITSDSRRLRLS
jgi:hypothetical protein